MSVRTLRSIGHGSSLSAVGRRALGVLAVALLTACPGTGPPGGDAIASSRSAPKQLSSPTDCEPTVRIFPAAGPVGTRIDFVGECFDHEAWLSTEGGGGYSIFLMRTDLPDCELLAGEEAHIRVGVLGDAEGWLRVPTDGSCFQADAAHPVTPGRYALHAFCHVCEIRGGAFEVTSEPVAPRCDPRMLEPDLGTDGATSMVGVYLGMTLRPGRPACTLEMDLTMALLDADGRPLRVRGNPARAAVSANLWTGSDRRTTVTWVWQNWCGEHRWLRLVASSSDGWMREVSDLTTPRCDVPDGASTLGGASGAPEEQR